MFGTGHPQPPHRKEVAMQIVQQQRKAFSATELAVDPPEDGRVGAKPDGQPLQFDVAYTLDDYLGMLREHVGFLLRHAAPEAKRRRVLVPLALGGLACVLAAAAALAAAPGWMGVLLLALGALAFGSLPGTAGFWVLLTTPLFLFRQRRMPLCAFTIDGTAVAHRSARGEFRRGWDEVTGVRSYRRGYLLLFARGALPIPFRCLDSDQLQRLRALALARRAGGRATGGIIPPA
jgi:hypothetical protein